MNLPKKLLIRFGLIFVGIILTLSLFHWLTKKEEYFVMVAGTKIEMGEPLTEQNLNWTAWPKQNLTEDLLIQGTFDHRPMKNFVATRLIVAGEPITKYNVVDKSQFKTLSSAISVGKQAISIILPANTLAGGAIRAGEIVDVNITMGKNATSHTKTALCGVKILSIGSEGTNPSMNPVVRKLKAERGETPKLVILEVTSEQAKKLTSALSIGNPSLILRSNQESYSKCIEENINEDDSVDIIQAE